MIAAISPVSFMNLTPILPVSLPGIVGAGLLPAAGPALLPDISAIVSLAGAVNGPLTYTATGTFRTSVQITPGTTPTGGAGPLTQRVHLEFDVDLDLLIIRDRATAGSSLSNLPPDTIRILADAMTTDLLLASLGSSNGTTGNLAAQALGGVFGGLGSPLSGNTLFGNPLNGTTALAGNNAVTSVSGTATTSLNLTIDTAPAATATAPTITAAAPTAVTAAAPAIELPTAITLTTGTATTAAVVAPAAGTVALTPAPTAAAGAATDTTLQRFLTDAAARALDTVANNPTYAAAAASLYASVAVFRGPEVTALAVDAVRQVGPAAAVQPLPSSVT